LSDEQILTGNVGTAYDTLTKSIIATAKARAFSDQIAKNSLDLLTLEQQGQDNVTKILEKRTELAKLEALQSNQAASNRGAITGLDLQIFQLRSDIVDLEKSQVSLIENSNTLKTDNLKLEAGITKEIESGAKFTKTQFEELQNVKRTLEDISGIQRSLELARLERRGQFFEGVEAPINVTSGRTETQGIIIPENLASNFDTQADQIKLKVEELSQAFTGLGSLIGRAFNNPQLGTFLGQFAAFAAKLIATNFKIASANAVTGATNASLATGPAAPFTLPGFIAASLGLVAGAFAAFGKGGGGRGIGSVGTSGISGGSSFTGTGGQSFNSAQNINLVGQFRVSGTDLVYVIDRTKESQI
jgi:hypothetical protein